jgi:hypothetical protein
MSYKNLIAKRTKREAKKQNKAKKKRKCDRKLKSSKEANASKSKIKVARMNEAQVEKNEIAPKS